MLDKFKQLFLYGHTYYGVEHTVVDNKECILAISLKKKKNTLDIVLKEKIETLENIIDYIPKKSGIALVVNNDKVLSKKTPSPHDGDDNKLIQNAYPNINIKEFYFDILRQPDCCFIAICRKEYIDALIDDYRNKNLYVISVSFGNQVVSNMHSFLNSKEIFTSNAVVTKNQDGISDINKQSNSITHEYDINGLQVSSTYLLSFAATLNVVLSKKIYEHSNFDTRYKVLNTDFQQQRFFSQFLKIGLLFILIALLINFFIFNHYFNKVSELRQTSQVNESSKNQLITLKEDVDKKEKFITDILKSESSKSSFYTNAIMVSLPESIRVSELNFQPLIKRVKTDKPIEYETDIIHVNGVSSVPTDISNWISDLEQIEWIEKVVITDYSESNKSLTEFSLNIAIR